MHFSTIITVRSLKWLSAFISSFLLLSLTSELLKIWFCQLACCSSPFSHWAPSLPKSRFTQERRAIERFKRVMCTALVYILLIYVVLSRWWRVRHCTYTCTEILGIGGGTRLFFKSASYCVQLQSDSNSSLSINCVPLYRYILFEVQSHTRVISRGFLCGGHFGA